MSDQLLRETLCESVNRLIDRINDTHLEASNDSVKDDTSHDHLLWMLNQCLENHNKWPVDKVSRWVGYVSGVLTARGYMTSLEERNASREGFHRAYAALGLEIPPTTERS